MSNSHDHNNANHSLHAGYAALGVVAVLILAKTFAYYASGSASILSSLTDSVMDSFVSFTAVLSLHYAPRRAAPLTQALCANAHGFSLHAGVCCDADQRRELEQLARYVTRPAAVYDGPTNG